MRIKSLTAVFAFSLCLCSTMIILAAEDAPTPASTDKKAQTVETKAAAKASLPRLVDLGATKCIPCKKMAPILDELKKAYEGRLVVEFIDVWQNPDAGKKYNIDSIPTQIFYSPDGKELFRHEGFFSKEDILAKWKELGHEFTQDGKQK